LLNFDDTSSIFFLDKSLLSKNVMAEQSTADKTAERMKKLKELHLKRNEARNLNHQEVVEESRRNNLPQNWEARKRRADWQLSEIEGRKEAEADGKDYDREKMLSMQADVAHKIHESRRRKRNPDQGFSDYEAMTLRQYDRMTKQIKPNMESYEGQKEAMGEDFFPSSNTLIQGSHYPSKEAMDRLVADIGKQEDKRTKFHRRRLYDPDAPIDFINERNRKFNAKIERYFGEYTEEIKQNLERGTAV